MPCPDELAIDSFRGGVTPLAMTMLEQFDAHLKQTPNAVAVLDDHSSRTYCQLHRESCAYSQLLQQNGINREAIVAIVAERGARYVAMLLGVLRSGGAFMPVEAGTPVARAQRICATSRVRAILAPTAYQSFAAELVAGWVGDYPPVILDAVETSSNGTTREQTLTRERDGLAYLIFTSGSTGVPKGAMVTNRGMDNHLAAKVTDLALDSGDCVGFTAPLSFDISVWQAVCALCAGGRTCVADSTNLAEPAELVAWVQRHGVTILEIVPSFLAVVLDLLSEDELRSGFGSLRFLISTGEALPIQLAQRWHECCPDIPLMNAYGPTECSDDVTHHVVNEVDRLDRAWPSIGREIINTDIFIVDAQGNETDNQTEGDLLVGGRGVGRGYVGDPVSTALAFVPDYLSGRTGQRLYRTGDRAVRQQDQTIDYLGRQDRQVKVRGHRVELGDVEAQLLQVTGVAAAACVFDDDRMRAFVTLQNGWEDLRHDNAVLEAVRKSAPSFLVPQELTVLDRLPTGSSGKADYRALERFPASDDQDPAPGDGERDNTGQVKALFAEILGLPSVAGDDDFFGSGGDSLQAMMLISRARTQFQVHGISLREFMQDPTPGHLLGLIDIAKIQNSTSLLRPEREEANAVSSGQERLCFLEQLHPARGAQLLRLMLTIRGPLNLPALQHALDSVVARHEPLRAVFSYQVGVPTQTVWPEAKIPLTRINVAADEPLPDLFQDHCLSAQTGQPPLAIAQLATRGPDHHVLTVALHHLIADGWSLEVLSRDINDYYQRFIDGELDIALPPTSYRDYVATERQWLASHEAVECEQYWIEQLADAPQTIDLPLDRPHSRRPDFTADHVVCELAADETAQLGKVSREMSATPFMAVMAGFYIALRELTGTSDIVVGIDTANRSWPGSEQLVGTFVNQLPLRMFCPAAAPTFRDLLTVSREQCLGAYLHERLPFHKIVAAVNPPRQASRFPLFQVKLTQQGAWWSTLDLPTIQVTPAEISEPVIHFDIMLDVSVKSDRLQLELVFRPEVLNRDTAANWGEAIGRALRTGGSDPDSPIAFGTFIGNR